ncbi:ABC transporter permease [Nocardioides kongjuensis]|mgnify:CR=1 FL=1|uniref:Peptide/nickel transport system permease protein n=1 Tax=Nocardioides kongjuensis TaxID=349522 RepID=A0A852R707_9ACTN|nr:peptide/nickel transport system permease protein [Nocardioides kongjuensis]
MTVLTFAGKRIASLLVVMLAASFLVFSLMELAPGSPLTFLLGNRSASPEQIARVEARYHLDDPFLVRYWTWLTDVLHGDLGRSVAYKQDVLDLLGPRVLTTVGLVLLAGLLIAVAGVGLGLLAGTRPGPVDGVITFVTTSFLATPVFVSGVALIWVFASQLDWLPLYGAGSGFGDRLVHLVLPAVTLSLASAAYLARITRAAVSDELRSEHVETARSRGLSSGYVLRHHVLRNSMIPITTVLGLTIATLIAGAVVVENVFALDGLGSLLVEAILRSDFVVVQAVILALVATFVVVNTLVDVVYVLVDPRISLS